MTDKIIKYSLPFTLFILLAQTFYPSGMFASLNSISMLILGLLVYSIGWWSVDFVYDNSKNDFAFSRKVALAAIFATPIVAIIFVPSYLYPYIVGKGFIFRLLSIIATLATIYTVFTKAEYKPKLTPFMIGSFFFTLAMGLATIFSIDPSRSFWSNFERME